MAGKLSINQRLGAANEQRGPLLCAWLNMPGGFQAGVFAQSGLEAVLIDMQHGIVGYNDMVAMVQAINGAGSFAFVRPPLDDFAMVSRALDVGAAGIVCPMINDAGDARRLVAVAKFPPLGERSWGGYLGQSHLGLSKDEILTTGSRRNAVFAMVETATALSNLNEICAVEGLDGIFVGPNDLCISLTDGKAVDVNHEKVQAALPVIVAAAQKAGIFTGIFTSDSDEVKKYAAMGFQFMPALNDVAFIRQGAALKVGECGEQ